MTLHSTITLPGVFMNIFGVGTLITGDSGIGKSELALILIDRGHQLISDDVTEFSSTHEYTIMGQAPSLLKDFLEIPGMGVFNIRALFGPASLLEKQSLNLIIHLQKVESLQREIEDNETEQPVLDIAIPKMTLPLVSGRYKEVLIETIVRNHLLKLQGYQANSDFVKRHRVQLGQEA